MHVARENPPAAGRLAGRAKTTRSSRRSWPSEKHRAGSLEVKDPDRAWQALLKALLSCHVERSETSLIFRRRHGWDRSEILRFAQNDKTPALQLFNLLAMKSALHK